MSSTVEHTITPEIAKAIELIINQSREDVKNLYTNAYDVVELPKLFGIFKRSTEYVLNRDRVTSFVEKHSEYFEIDDFNDRISVFTKSRFYRLIELSNLTSLAIDGPIKVTLKPDHAFELSEIIKRLNETSSVK